jgi:hypothetical protein
MRKKQEKRTTSLGTGSSFFSHLHHQQRDAVDWYRFLSRNLHLARYAHKQMIAMIVVRFLRNSLPQRLQQLHLNQELLRRQ